MNKQLRLKRKDANAIRDFVQRTRAALGGQLVALKLFGSKATGRDAPDSDIDVLVVVEEASVKIEDQVLDIAFEVNLAHEVYVSPRVIARATLNDPVWRITPFLQALAKEGVPL
jgi:predicted nucleotidyltransferase